MVIILTDQKYVHMFWQMDEDIKIPLISNNITRYRFQEIKRYKHLPDNSELDLCK